MTDKTHKTRLSIILSTALVATFTYYALPPIFNELQRRMVTIFLVAAIFWATEALPLFATSLLIIGFEIIFLAEVGGLAKWIPAISVYPPTKIHYSIFINSFGSSIIILFMGGFLLSRAMTKHKVDRLIACKLLIPLSKNPKQLIFGVLCITAFLSMWISNTATAAMMLAIITPLLKEIPKKSNYRTALILAVPFGANIGGVGTPIGTPPNAIAFEILEKTSINEKVGFFDWVLMALPLEISVLFITGWILIWYAKPYIKLNISIKEKKKKMPLKGILTLIILLLAILLWLTGSWTGIGPAVVALLIAAVLTAFGILDKKDVDSINWNILILMWGGISMGTAIQESGLTDLIKRIPFTEIPGGVSGIAIILILTASLLSTFMSNTATANLMIPISLSLTIGASSSHIQFVILTALACSFSMAMPISTPSNALAFSTGEIKAKDLSIIGGLITIISIFSIFSYHFLFPTAF